MSKKRGPSGGSKPSSGGSKPPTKKIRVLTTDAKLPVESSDEKMERVQEDRMIELLSKYLRFPVEKMSTDKERLRAISQAIIKNCMPYDKKTSDDLLLYINKMDDMVIMSHNQRKDVRKKQIDSILEDCKMSTLDKQNNFRTISKAVKNWLRMRPEEYIAIIELCASFDIFPFPWATGLVIIDENGVKSIRNNHGGRFNTWTVYILRLIVAYIYDFLYRKSVKRINALIVEAIKKMYDQFDVKKKGSFEWHTPFMTMLRNQVINDDQYLAEFLTQKVTTKPFIVNHKNKDEEERARLPPASLEGSSSKQPTKPNPNSTVLPDRSTQKPNDPTHGTQKTSGLNLFLSTESTPVRNMQRLNTHSTQKAKVNNAVSFAFSTIPKPPERSIILPREQNPDLPQYLGELFPSRGILPLTKKWFEETSQTQIDEQMKYIEQCEDGAYGLPLTYATRNVFKLKRPPSSFLFGDEKILKSRFSSVSHLPNPKADEEFRFVGAGEYGAVMVVNWKGVEGISPGRVVVKVQKIDGASRNSPNPHIHTAGAINEILIHYALTNAIPRIRRVPGLLHNIPQMLGWTITSDSIQSSIANMCPAVPEKQRLLNINVLQKPIFKKEPRDVDLPSAIYVMEHAGSKTLYDEADNIKFYQDEILFGSCMLQVLSTLHRYQMKVRFSHNDLHINNILLEEPNAKSGGFVYEHFSDDSKHYVLPFKHGKFKGDQYIVRIIDFGFSSATFKTVSGDVDLYSKSWIYHLMKCAEGSDFAHKHSTESPADLKSRYWLLRASAPCLDTDRLARCLLEILAFHIAGEDHPKRLLASTVHPDIYDLLRKMMWRKGTLGPNSKECFQLTNAIYADISTLMDFSVSKRQKTQVTQSVHIDNSPELIDSKKRIYDTVLARKIVAALRRLTKLNYIPMIDGVNRNNDENDLGKDMRSSFSDGGDETARNEVIYECNAPYAILKNCKIFQPFEMNKKDATELYNESRDKGLIWSVPTSPGYEHIDIYLQREDMDNWSPFPLQPGCATQLCRDFSYTKELDEYNLRLDLLGLDPMKKKK